ncbi:MAG: DUF480 domain-containing protein [Phycisphaerae bacterium]|nr:YceH family protein [Phycisphaerae bacterium]NUQ46468.1 DUF480 domain-containing protein [Phycisphaerae bacterium]
MSLVLNAMQRRVLGVLIEKSMSQPEYYPMTVNAVVNGANQRSSRNPVMNLDEADVTRTLRELQYMELASQAEPQPGARALRFRHEVERKLGWDTRTRAVMAELLLRGPQTAGELRGRASRLTPLDSVEFVQQLLNELATRDPPLVREMPRAPGQAASRYMHTLYLSDEPPPVVGPVVLSEESAAAAPAVAGAAHVDDLARRVQELESSVDELKVTVDELRDQLGTLRMQLGA